jgi:hypothetical protein
MDIVNLPLSRSGRPIDDSGHSLLQPAPKNTSNSYLFLLSYLGMGIAMHRVMQIHSFIGHRRTTSRENTAELPPHLSSLPHLPALSIYRTGHRSAKYMGPKLGHQPTSSKPLHRGSAHQHHQPDSARARTTVGWRRPDMHPSLERIWNYASMDRRSDRRCAGHSGERETWLVPKCHL